MDEHSDEEHLIYYAEDKTFFYLSHAYQNGFGSIEMAWATRDPEKAKMRLRLAKLDNPQLENKLFITSF